MLRIMFVIDKGVVIVMRFLSRKRTGMLETGSGGRLTTADFGLVMIRIF
jgi:hypothetical protein